MSRHHPAGIPPAHHRTAAAARRPAKAAIGRPRRGGVPRTGRRSAAGDPARRLDLRRRGALAWLLAVVVVLAGLPATAVALPVAAIAATASPAGTAAAAGATAAAPADAAHGHAGHRPAAAGSGHAPAGAAHVAAGAAADAAGAPCHPDPADCCRGGLCPMLHCGGVLPAAAAAPVPLPSRSRYDTGRPAGPAGIAAAPLFRPPIAA